MDILINQPTSNNCTFSVTSAAASIMRCLHRPSNTNTHKKRHSYLRYTDLKRFSSSHLQHVEVLHTRSCLKSSRFNIFIDKEKGTALSLAHYALAMSDGNISGPNWMKNA